MRDENGFNPSRRQSRARTLRVDFQGITSNSEACLTEFEKSVLDNVRDLKSNPATN